MILTFIELEFLNCTFEIECKTKIVILVKFKKAGVLGLRNST